MNIFFLVLSMLSSFTLFAQEESDWPEYTLLSRCERDGLIQVQAADGRNVTLTKVLVDFSHRTEEQMQGLFQVNGMTTEGKRYYFGSLVDDCLLNEKGVNCFTKGVLAARGVRTGPIMAFDFFIFSPALKVAFNINECQSAPFIFRPVNQDKILFEYDGIFHVGAGDILFRARKLNSKINPVEIEVWSRNQNYSFMKRYVSDKNDPELFTYGGAIYTDGWPVTNDYSGTFQLIDLNGDGKMEKVVLEPIPSHPLGYWRVVLKK